ncbi:trigger factor [Patescibacteria group bacterium]|nr:trigger factor [Patescibacteria group bacterium]
MRVKINKLPKSQIELEIEVPADEFDNFIERATLNLGKDLEIRGFRKGKAPKNIIEEHIGPEKILIEAGDLAVNETYKKAVLENKIEAIFQPKIEIKKLAKGSDLVFSAKTAVLPEIKLPDYRKIASNIKRNKVVVEEKEIENALKWLQKSRAKFTLKNQPAQKGDFVEIEYWSAQIQGEGRKDAFILGEGHFIPGFEEKLIGMKAEEEKDGVSINIPENHPFQKLGKQITLKVKMKSIQNVELPKVDDQFAKSLGKFENLNALKNNVKEGLNLEKERVESQRVREEILEKISQASKSEIPEVLIEQEQKQMLEDLKKMVSERLKIPFEDYLKKLKKTEKEVIDSFLSQTQKKVKNFLVLREIGKRELDSEEIKKYTQEAEKIEKIFQLLENL